MAARAGFDILRHLDPRSGATRYFKVRDYVRAHQVRVRHIATDVNVADFFTKGLDKNLFIKFRGYLGMDNFASP